MFRNNQNKQRTNRNSSTFVKISTFLIPHTISSVCFGSFDTAPKHRNKPKKFFLGFVKKQTEQQLKHIEFWFVSVRTEKKKFTVLRTPKFFEIYSVCFGLFRENSVCFGCFDTDPKHRNKPKKTKKMFFGFAKQTEKQLKQIEFRFEPKKKFDCFEDTLLPMSRKNYF